VAAGLKRGRDMARRLQSGTAGKSARVDMDSGGVAARLRERFPEDVRFDADLDHLAEINDRLVGNEDSAHAVHGEMWLGNVLLAARDTGVVDWEASTTSGEPIATSFASRHVRLFLDRGPGPSAVSRAPRPTGGQRGAGVEFALDGVGGSPTVRRSSKAAWRDRSARCELAAMRR